MKFEQLRPGMQVYDVHSYRMGNTPLRSVGIWPVRVIEIHADQSITASWNGNSPKRIYPHQWKKYRINAPELERDEMGRMRIKKHSA